VIIGCTMFLLFYQYYFLPLNLFSLDGRGKPAGIKAYFSSQQSATTGSTFDGIRKIAFVARTCNKQRE
jgi:hypothetical protein